MPLCSPPEEIINETVRFPSGPCLLEGELAYPEGTPIGAALLAGPHPLLGGNRDNNVVRALGDGLARSGLVTLRFNYRGVGASTGPAVDVAAHLTAFWQTSRAPDDAAYQADLDAARLFLRWVTGPGLPSAFIGYSFGCTLLPATLTPADHAAPLVLVAPTVGPHDYAAYESVCNPILAIAPEDDFAADAGQVSRWLATLPGPRQLVQPRLDSHFFRGHEEWLVSIVRTFLDSHWR
jgi:alpha/beta superfamily hydrolase